MALDIAIAGFSINHRNFKIVKNLDMSADLSFGVVDSSGLNHYSNRQPVTVSDTIKGVIFAGYIDQPDEQNLYPTVQNTITIHCMDYREKALKRRPTVDYAGMLAGDIAVDMHFRYLAAEGVIANYAYRNDTTQADFNAQFVQAQDTFHRANQSGFGTSSDSETYTFSGHAATESIVSNEGVVSATTGADTHAQLGSQTLTDQQVQCRIAINNASDIAGVEARFSSASGSTCYKLLWYSGDIHFNKSVSGTNTVLSNYGGFAMALGTFYQFKIACIGTMLYGKVWLDGTAEPANWMLTTSDASVASGGFALLANSNTGSGIQFDHFTVTLAGAMGTNNVGDGDLEIAPAGAPLTIATNTTALWGAGTLNSVVAVNNQLLLKSRNGIALSADNNGNQGNNAYVYWQIWAGSYVIASGDALTYKVWINKNCPEIRAAMDFTCTDGSSLSHFMTGGHFLSDQNGIDALPATDLKGFADDQWYYRYIDLTPMAGKTIAAFTIAFEGNAGGHYAAYFFDTLIMNGATTKLTIYANNGVLNTSKRSQDIGYSTISVTTPLVYDTPGTRISPSTSLTSVGIANTGIAAISSTIPTGTSLEVDTSFDNGATWQPATDRTAIAGLIAGAALTGISFMTRQVLAITGDDPTVTPAVSSVAASFTPSSVATKHDSFNQANTTAEWNSLGTNQGGVTIANQLTLSNWRRNWDDALLTSQALFGNASPAHGPNYKRLFIMTNSGTDVSSRMDFAGTYNNFTLSVDIQIPANAADSVGVTYRTTNWGNGNNSWGWSVNVSQSFIQLGYGSNNGAATTQAYTSVQVFNPASFAPTAGSVHTLTVIANGTNHQVWLDGVQYINITNATYSGNTGYVAMHAFNGSGINTSYFFDNFGIGGFLTGAYETNNISLNTLATVGDSFIAWQNEPLPAGCSILVQSTIDGGSTFQTCTNGAEIPGLTPGTNTVGKNLRIYISFTAPSVAYTPILDGLLIWVTSSYSASGTRIAPALNLFNGRAGSSSLTWNDILPTGCTVGMDISPDGTTWTDVSANNGQPLPSALIFAQPDPWLDFFAVDSSANYTSVDYT
jgi:hypothetical protein